MDPAGLGAGDDGRVVVDRHQEPSNKETEIYEPISASDASKAEEGEGKRNGQSLSNGTQIDGWKDDLKHLAGEAGETGNVSERRTDAKPSESQQRSLRAPVLLEISPATLP